MLYEAFRAGYELPSDDVPDLMAHSPIQVKQTTETAKELGRRLREMNDRILVAEASLGDEYDG